MFPPSMFGWEIDRTRENNRKWRNVKQAEASSSRQNATRLDTTIYNRSSPTIGGTVASGIERRPIMGTMYSVVAEHKLQQHEDNHFYERTPSDGNRTNRTELCKKKKKNEPKYNNEKYIAADNNNDPANGRKRVVLCIRASHAVEVNHLSFGRKYNQHTHTPQTHTRRTHTAKETKAEEEELTKNGAPKSIFFFFRRWKSIETIWRRVKRTWMHARACAVCSRLFRYSS